jgi:hypothetical protein
VGCLLVLLAWISPRFVIALMWVFTERLEIAFRSGWVALAGFVFLPYTTAAWAIAYQTGVGVSGIGWILVGLAVLGDLGSWAGGDKRRRRRR